MQQSIFSAAVELMIYGMGTVVLFLGLLVLTTIAMSSLVERFAPSQLPRQSAAAGTGSSAGDPDEETLTAIAAAIHRYREQHRR